MSMAGVSIFEVVDGLRLVNCGQCACLYAVPVAVFLQAAKDQKAIHCPHGHTWTPASPDAESSSNVSQTIYELSRALMETATKFEAAKRRIDELTPLAGTPSLKELRRRSHILAERAEGVEAGRALCPYCGQKKYRNSLAEHIRRQHKQLLIENPVNIVA